jgi:hypothetical protein
LQQTRLRSGELHLDRTRDSGAERNLLDHRALLWSCAPHERLSCTTHTLLLASPLPPGPAQNVPTFCWACLGRLQCGSHTGSPNAHWTLGCLQRIDLRKSIGTRIIHTLGVRVEASGCGPDGCTHQHVSLGACKAVTAVQHLHRVLQSCSPAYPAFLPALMCKGGVQQCIAYSHLAGTVCGASTSSRSPCASCKRTGGHVLVGGVCNTQVRRDLKAGLTGLLWCAQMFEALGGGRAPGGAPAGQAPLTVHFGVAEDQGEFCACIRSSGGAAPLAVLDCLPTDLYLVPLTGAWSVLSPSLKTCGRSTAGHGGPARHHPCNAPDWRRRRRNRGTRQRARRPHGVPGEPISSLGSVRVCALPRRTSSCTQARSDLPMLVRPCFSCICTCISAYAGTTCTWTTRLGAALSCAPAGAMDTACFASAPGCTHRRRSRLSVHR